MCFALLALSPWLFRIHRFGLLATSNRGYLEYRPDRAVLRITASQWRLALPVDVISGWQPLRSNERGGRLAPVPHKSPIERFRINNSASLDRSRQTSNASSLSKGSREASHRGQPNPGRLQNTGRSKFYPLKAILAPPSPNQGAKAKKQCSLLPQSNACRSQRHPKCGAERVWRREDPCDKGHAALPPTRRVRWCLGFCFNLRDLLAAVRPQTSCALSRYIEVIWGIASISRSAMSCSSLRILSRTGTISLRPRSSAAVIRDV